MFDVQLLQVDDLIATGGTLRAGINLIRESLLLPASHTSKALVCRAGWHHTVDDMPVCTWCI